MSRPLEQFAVDESAVMRENRRLRSSLKTAESERAEYAKALDLIRSLEAAEARAPKWLSPKKPSKANHAIVNLLVTDTHFDEVVRPEEVDFVNSYDRRIAEMRLKRCFEKTIELARDYLAGVTYDGAVLMLGGDIFSGNIHEELEQTNVSTLFDAVLHYVEIMQAGITMLAEEFGKVHVAGVVGNHGRQTKKPRAKNRARDNVDWLLYKLLARDFKPDDRITFQVPDASDALINVYDTTFLLTHGDQFRGGTGISGALAPLMLGSHRKTRRQAASGHPYDVMVLGHWHQYISIPGKGLLVGGSLKGYDEYAYVSNFEPEPPQQAFWLTTREHGVTFSAPVFVADRKKEGW